MDTLYNTNSFIFYILFIDFVFTFCVVQIEGVLTVLLSKIVADQVRCNPKSPSIRR
jgi:hypothetical protein